MTNTNYTVHNSRGTEVFADNDLTNARCYYELHMKRGWFIKYPSRPTTPEVIMLIDTYNDDLPIMAWNSTDERVALDECDRNNGILMQMRYRLVKVTLH